MRWFSGGCALGLSAVIAFGGCGSDRGSDDLVMSFQGFTGDVGEQADAVGQNTADVDVCQSICVTSGAGDIIDSGSVTAEPYTVTRVGAIFVNQGKADITLESYTLSVFRDLNGNGVRDPGEPGSGVPNMTFSASTLLPGGRCVSNPQQKCAFDSECVGGCQRQETTVELLLYDFTFKDLVKDGDCPAFDLDNGTFFGGSIVPQTYNAIITFRGIDDTNTGYNITESYNSTFADLDNCEEE
jgi:hypothetical protein